MEAKTKDLIDVLKDAIRKQSGAVNALSDAEDAVLDGCDEVETALKEAEAVLPPEVVEAALWKCGGGLLSRDEVIHWIRNFRDGIISRA
jgi:hypothetical protein